MYTPSHAFPFETLSAALAALRTLLRLHLSQGNGRYAAITQTNGALELMPSSLNRVLLQKASAQLQIINSLLCSRAGMPPETCGVTDLELMNDNLLVHLGSDVLCQTPLDPEEAAEKLLAHYPAQPIIKAELQKPAVRRKIAGAAKPVVSGQPGMRRHAKAQAKAPVFVSRRH